MKTLLDLVFLRKNDLPIDIYWHVLNMFLLFYELLCRYVRVLSCSCPKSVSMLLVNGTLYNAPLL